MGNLVELKQISEECDSGGGKSVFIFIHIMY